jgi:hypothetical protein
MVTKWTIVSDSQSSNIRRDGDARILSAEAFQIFYSTGEFIGQQSEVLLVVVIREKFF